MLNISVCLGRPAQCLQAIAEAEAQSLKMDAIPMRCLIENPKKKRADSITINLLAPYALAIWYGARFISGKGYTGGQVLNVFDSKLLHEVASDLLFERSCPPA